MVSLRNFSLSPFQEKNMYISRPPFLKKRVFSLSDFPQSLRVNVGLASPLRYELSTLWLKIRFLQVFLSCGGNHNNIENRSLQDLLVYIRTVFQRVDLDIRRCRADFKFSSKKESEAFDLRWHKFDTQGWWFPMNMDDLLSSAQQRLERLKPHIHEVYILLTKSSRSTLHGDSESATNNLQILVRPISGLLEDCAEMVAPIKEELEVARENLVFLDHLLRFTSKRCSKLGKLKDLIIHAEFMADKMSCLLYMCSSNEKMNDSMANEMKINLSSELQNFSPAQPHVRQIYIKALKASKLARGDSAVVDYDGWDFLESLGDNILQLPNSKLSFTASNNDQILSLHKELQFLTRSLAMFKSSETVGYMSLQKEAGITEHDHICNYFLERISAAIIDMGCLIYSLHNNEQTTDEAKELKRVVYDLQDIIKTAKEDARKAFDTVVPQSSRGRTEFQTTNAQGMMDSLMSISEKIAGQYGDILLLHPSKVLQEEMQSLIGTFSNLIAEQQLENGELEIQMKRLNDIRSETKSLMLSHRSRRVWEHNLWLFVLIEEIKMIEKGFRYLENQMMHGTSTSIGRMNPREKDTMIDYAEISKNEPERTRKKLIIGSKKIHSLPITVGIHGIEDHNSNLDLICPLNDEVKALRLRAGVLNIFLSCKGIRHIEDGNLKVLLARLRSVFQNLDQDLRRLLSDLTSPKEVRCLPMNMDCLLSTLLLMLKDIQPRRQRTGKVNTRCLPMNMDCLLSTLLLMLKDLQPDIKGVYSILLKSSSVIFGINGVALVENLNSLLENIELLLKCDTELVASLKEELEAVLMSLRFLRNFLSFTEKRCSKLGKLKDLLIHSEFLAGKISCLLYLCCDNENEIKMHLSSELQKFSLGQPGDRKLGFLDSLREDMLELSNNNLSFTASNIKQILSLYEEVKFLITFFTMDRSLEEHPEHDQISTSLFEHINAVVIDHGCFIFLLNDDENNEMMTGELKKKVSDLVEKFMVAKEDIRKNYALYIPRPLRSDFPSTDGCVFIGSLFRNLKELLTTKPDLVAPLKYQIKIVQNELLSLREDFGKIAEQPNQWDELQCQWTRFLDIAYQTEFIIDSFVIGDDPIYYHELGLFIVIEEIKTIKIVLRSIKIKTTDETSVLKPSRFSTQDSLEPNVPKYIAGMSSKGRLADETNTTKLVIFEEEAKKIQEKLTRGPKKLHIISIVGMPGIGKTTLADSVFHHSSVTNHFHARGRCSVSQVHDKRRLFLEILQEVAGESKRFSDDDDDDNVGRELYQCLKGRRYLILLDDIWNIQSWKDIKASFPDDKNGSRIIFTSRYEDIATQTKLESINFPLSPIPEEKSWEVLQAKLFGNKSCPPELVSVGYEIAANCKGLPLTIDLVAGILRVKERKEWNDVVRILMTILFEDPEECCHKVLENSYRDLPDDWKPCFLYFGAFPEDENVPTKDLICLWIAEGFITLRMGETRSLEDEAEDILNNLIRRSLVIVSKRGPLGGVIKSRVHDLLHEFAIKKAQKESFMLKIGDLDLCLTESSTCELGQLQEHHRLCMYPSCLWKLRESKQNFRAKALITHTPLIGYGSLNLRNFKLLRVLYFRRSNCPYFPEMFTLIHLRLLAISVIGTSEALNIISDVHKLQNLETFIMYGAMFIGDENLLLDKICNMVRLRHFRIEDTYVGIRYLSEEIWQKASFTNLQSLYGLTASYEEDIEKILQLMPNLVELKVLFYNLDGRCYPFPKLDLLTKLESLEVKHKNYHGSSYPCEIISFPPNLKSLVITNFGVPWNGISDMGNLEYLEVLELRNGAFRGSIWNMIDDGLQFPRLKYLILYDLDIEEWKASEDHLPSLEELRVARCTELKELPSCLEEIGTLRAIKLIDCTKEVENLARRIKEQQDQMLNEQFVVDITDKFTRDFSEDILWEDV